jgi:hypothetical protein
MVVATVAAIVLSVAFGGGRGQREAAPPRAVGPPRVAKPLADPGPRRVIAYVRGVNGNPVLITHAT